MNKRILFNLFILAGVLWAPWWVTLFFVIAGVFIFKFYYEAIFFGVVSDLLYGTVTSFGFGMIGLVTAFAILFFVPRVKDAIRPTH